MAINIKTDLVHPFANSDKNEKANLNTNYSTQENKKNIINLASKEKDKEKRQKIGLFHEYGYIHGQHYDLLRIFDHCGYPGEYNYLF